MAIEKAVLLIADIGGYTRFMKQHRFSLSHAQDTVAQLLEAIIDASGQFKLAKLEGDAAFFYALGDVASVGRHVTDIRRAFLSRRQRLEVDRMCTCEGCLRVGELKLKFVIHSGEVAFQKVKHHTELAGVDVILVHRMLKNDVPVPEYVLMTDGVREKLDPELRPFARGLEHQFEGLGVTATHYVDLNAVAHLRPEALAPSLPRKLWNKLMMELRSLPYLLGLKKPCEDFRNVEIIDAREASLQKPN